MTFLRTSQAIATDQWHANSDADVDADVPGDAFQDLDGVAREHQHVHGVIHEASSNDTMLAAIAEKYGRCVQWWGLAYLYKRGSSNAERRLAKNRVHAHNDAGAQNNDMVGSMGCGTHLASAGAGLHQTNRATDKGNHIYLVDVHGPVSGLRSVRWVHWDTVDVANKRHGSLAWPLRRR